MSQTRQHSDSESQHSTRKKPSLESNGILPEYLGGLNPRQRNVLQLQRQIGNAAVQRLLAAPQSQAIQRQDLSEFGLGPANTSTTSDPSPTPTTAPTTQADAGEERLTSQEWLGRVKDPVIMVQSPMIGFSVDDTFAGFPTTQVQAFDFSAPAE